MCALLYMYSVGGMADVYYIHVQCRGDGGCVHYYMYSVRGNGGCVHYYMYMLLLAVLLVHSLPSLTIARHVS